MSDFSHVSRVVPQSPDESLLDAIGNQHSLESALADLVDNSIEHGGTSITIQLITADSKLQRLRVVDNGRGMTPRELEEGMQLRKKLYSKTSLSYFGMGMKMASLSQSAILRVFTRDENGIISGAQMRRKDAGGLFNTEIFENEYARSEYESFRRDQPGSGTVVEWQRIDDVAISKSQNERVRWLSEKIRLIQKHFSLVFHRFLEKGKIRIFIELWDSQSQQVGTRTPISPLDPFAYRTPVFGYPTTFYGKTSAKTRIEMHCSIVPPGSESESVRVNGHPLERLSGFYVYRNDRLVQVGGWQELFLRKLKDLQFARIRIELTDELIDAGIKLTAEKTSVRFADEIKKAILSARSPQLERSFDDYINQVVELKKLSSKRNTGLQPTLRIEGLENTILRETVQTLIGFRPGQDKVQIVSVKLRNDQVFELDLDNDELRINSALFDEDGPLDSETGYEFFKATLYFLLESYFSKTALNKSTLHKIEQIHRVLAVALGIQAIDLGTTPHRLPTPAVIAKFAPPEANVQPITLTEEIDVPFFQSSRASHVSEKDRLHELAKEWRLSRAVEPETTHQENAEGTKKGQNEIDLPAHFRKDSDLAALGLAAVKSFKKNRDVASVAESLERSENEITALLAQLILGFQGVLDNREESFLADEPFTSSDREKLISKFKEGQDVARLSSDSGRTCLQVSREILDSPSIQVKISPEILRKLRDAAR